MIDTSKRTPPSTIELRLEMEENNISYSEISGKLHLSMYYIRNILTKGLFIDYKSRLDLYKAIIECKRKK
jgi:hypothetical protein